MKKSKIIIPAAAILALSVGASVTGTVAWFTAARTVSFGVSNMAVINTAGDLGVSLTAGIGTKISSSSEESTTSVELSYLRDASYDAIGDKAYVATLNNDGSKVTGTRNVEKTLAESVSITEGSSSSYKNVYVINEWTATFTTSSVAVNYLYFNPTNTVSKIDGNTLGEKSVYKAVRVAMRNTAEDDKHTVIWAPYTTDSSVYYVNKAGTLAESQTSNVAPIPENYLTVKGNAETTLVGKYTSTSVENKNLVAKHGNALVSEGISKDAAEANTALLSTKLQGKHKVGEQDVVSNPSITFTLWFEGLDPNCISATEIADVSTTTAKFVKSMTLGFYAVDSTTLSVAGA